MEVIADDRVLLWDWLRAAWVVLEDAEPWHGAFLESVVKSRPRVAGPSVSVRSGQRRLPAGDSRPRVAGPSVSVRSGQRRLPAGDSRPRVAGPSVSVRSGQRRLPAGD